jgi:hypothetical protein
MRAVSFTKLRVLERYIREHRALVAALRTSGLADIRSDPNGGRWDPRGRAILNYLGARMWVSHYRKILAESTPVKGATRHYVGDSCRANAEGR